MLSGEADRGACVDRSSSPTLGLSLLQVSQVATVARRAGAGSQEAPKVDPGEAKWCMGGPLVFEVSLMSRHVSVDPSITAKSWPAVEGRALSASRCNGQGANIGEVGKKKRTVESLQALRWRWSMKQSCNRRGFRSFR